MKKTFLITICLLFVAFLVACNSAQTEKHVHEEVQHTPIDIYDADADLMSLAPEDAWINDKETQEPEAPRVFVEPPPRLFLLLENSEQLLQAFENNQKYEAKGDRISFDNLSEEERTFAVLAAVADKIPSDGIMIPKYKGGEIVYSKFDQWGRSLNNEGVFIATHDVVKGFADICYYNPIASIITSPLSEEVSENTWSKGIKEYLNQRAPKLFSDEKIINTETEMNFGGEIIPVIISDYSKDENDDGRLHIRFIVGGNTYVEMLMTKYAFEQGPWKDISFERVEIPKYTGEYMEEIRKQDWYTGKFGG